MHTWTISPPIKAAILLILILIPLCIVPENTYGTIEWTLASWGSISLHTPITLDKTSVTFRRTVLLISFCVILFTTSYIREDKNLQYFVLIVLLFVISINFLIFFPNLITLLLGWDGLGITSYLLVIYYSNSKSLRAGILTALTNRIGDALLIMAIAWLWYAGHWNFSYSGYSLCLLATTIITLAAITKRAQIPFSTWLPAAIAAPTPVSALVHSSTLVTAGVYLIIRFFPTLRNFPCIYNICFYIGAITCLFSGLAATAEWDLKKIIALSTLRQLGVIIITLGIQQPQLAFLHLITHALFKALLFISAGFIIHVENNNQDIRLIGNIATKSPLVVVFFNTANLSLCGIPYLAGFYSKDSILESSFISYSPVSSYLILLGSLWITTAYTVRLSIHTLFCSAKAVNFQQYCRKLTYLAFLTLFLGSLISGAILRWTLVWCPPTIPTTIKILTLVIIIVYGTVTACFYTNHHSRDWIITEFTSLYYLSYITSSTTTKNTFNIAQILTYSESTFLEKFRGIGTKTILKGFSIIQKSNNINLSDILTIIGLRLSLILIISLAC